MITWKSTRSLKCCALIVALTALPFSVCCARTNINGNSSSNAAQGNASGGSAPADAVAPTPSVNDSSAEQKAATANLSLVSLSAGAIVVKKPVEFDDNWSSFWLLDENPVFGWSTKKGVIGDQVIVIALPELTRLNKVIFDTGSVDGNDGRGAKDVLVEISNTSETDGFQKIAEVSLQDKANNQTFPVSAEVPGSWVRLTVRTNHGSPDFTELFDFRATGTQLTHTPLPNVSGTYSTNYNDFHVRQEGTSVSGCYEYNEGLFEGGFSGRVLTFTWRQPNGKGPAIMVLTPDGKQMIGVWWFDGRPDRGLWYGKRKSDEVGSCAHWVGGIQGQITKDLEELGRARIYGINFDTDSDRIKDESKPTLDKLVGIMKAKPDWKLTIEGHTDSTSTPQHNQDLSERRAASVKNYLQSAGIDPSRLKTIGYGQTKPVASNDSELGRAQNRRVELTKQ
jgi:outer membrane protein OmpA-like peptidoglycan-associated protein